MNPDWEGFTALSHDFMIGAEAVAILIARQAYHKFRGGSMEPWNDAAFLDAAQRLIEFSDLKSNANTHQEAYDFLYNAAHEEFRELCAQGWKINAASS